jgi:hypothetical protein
VAANYDEKRLGRQRAVPKRLHPHLSQQHWRSADLDNLADRVIRPTLKAHNLMWKGWQAYRRGLATNLKDQRAWSSRHNYPVHFETREREYNPAFLHQDRVRSCVDAMKKLEEKISGTAVVQ